MTQTTQDFRGRLLSNSTGYIWDSLYPNGDRPASLWKLSKAQQYGQKLAMYAIYPRPSGEVQSKAFHLWAHSTMPYKHKPACFGGCWPHRWSLTSSPSGMTIGSELARSSVSGLTLHQVDANYQVINWTGAKSGSATVSYRCTDQLDNFVDYSHTVTVDDTRFIFVDVNAVNDSGDGTIGNPRKVLANVWSSANANKIVVLRAGTHVAGDSVDATQMLVSNRPTALIGYPGEAVNLDCSNHLFRDNNTAADDFLGRDITLTNIRNTDANTYGFLFGGQQNRITLDNIVFDNLRTGTVGDNNQSGISFLDSGSKSNNVVIIDCKLNSNCKIALTVTFNLDYLLIERPYANGVTQAAAHGFVHIKDQNNYACVRGIFFRGATSSGHPVRISNQNSPGTFQEHCWSTIISTDGTNCVNWNQQRFTSGGGPYFDYAGSYISATGNCHTDALWAPANVNVYVEGMAGYASALFEGGTGLNGYTQGTVTNTLLTGSQVDSTTGKLTDIGAAYRTTKGAELFS